MRTFYVLNILLVGICFLQSCKDEIATARVKTRYGIHKIYFNGQEQITHNGTDTFYYTPEGKYDSMTNGLITRMERKGDIVETRTYTQSGVVVSSSITYLDENAREDSVVIINGGHIAYIHKYIYNKEGFLVEDRQYSAQAPKFSVTLFEVENGNRKTEELAVLPNTDTSVVRDPATGKLDTFITRYYNILVHNGFYTDKPAMPTAVNYGKGPFDMGSKNLKKMSVQLSAKGDTEEVYYWNYTFDKKGRVVTEVETTRNRTEYDSVYYTYY